MILQNGHTLADINGHTTTVWNTWSASDSHGGMHPPGDLVSCARQHRLAQALESTLSDWVERILAVLNDDNEWEGVALDGKPLRGSKKQGATDTHPLLALSHRSAITLTQIAVPDKTNEIGAVRDLLVGLVMQGGESYVRTMQSDSRG
jgi:hypothetical protein